MKRKVSPETREKISRAMVGKRNAAGKHKMTSEGRAAIAAAQRRRWKKFRQQRKEEA